MVLWKPVNQKIYRTTLLLGPNARPPTRPFVDKRGKPDEPNHLMIWSPLDHTHRRPIPIEIAARTPARQDVIKLILGEIVVPYIFGSSLQVEFTSHKTL